MLTLPMFVYDSLICYNLSYLALNISNQYFARGKYSFEMDVETETSIDNPMRTVEIKDNSVKSSDNKEPYTVGKSWDELPLADKIEKVWCKVFSYMPFHRYFWTSYPHPQVVISKRKHHTNELLKQRRQENEEDYDASIRIRSMWNIRNLIDSIFFNWTTYLDSDKYLDDLDTKGQYYTELSNVGLLSALIRYFSIGIYRKSPKLLINIFYSISTAQYASAC